MARVIWTEQALDGLDALLNFIATDAPIAARRFAKRIIDRVDALEEFPKMGTWVEEDETRTYRQLIQGSYRLIYRIDGQTVYLVAIHHAARLLDMGKL